MNPNILEGKYALVVDDEETLANIVADELRCEGFEKVLVAYDGEECMPLLREFGEKIFVMTLNLRMPRKSGFDVMRHLAKGHSQIMAVIMVSGTDQLRVAQEFLDLGTENVLAYDYITKPFQFGCLISVIRKAVNEVDAKRKASLRAPLPVQHPFIAHSNQPAEPARQVGQRLLVVDDEDCLRQVLKKEFEEEGFQVDEAEDGYVAMERIRQNRYDAITLGVRMPRMDGMEVLRWLKTVPEPPKVVMLTGCDDLKVAIECKDLGAADFITKPYDTKTLTSCLRRVLSSED